MQIEPIILVIGLLIIIVLLAVFVSSKGAHSQDWKSDIRTRSNRIRNQVSRADISDQKQLLIEADKLLDHTLMGMKLPGTSLGERLKYAKGKLDRALYQQVWDAHKARNSMVHELDFQIDKQQLKSHVKVFLVAINKLTE